MSERSWIFFFWQWREMNNFMSNLQLGNNVDFSTIKALTRQLQESNVDCTSLRRPFPLFSFVTQNFFCQVFKDI